LEDVGVEHGSVEGGDHRGGGFVELVVKDERVQFLLGRGGVVENWFFGTGVGRVVGNWGLGLFVFEVICVGGEFSIEHFLEGFEGKLYFLFPGFGAFFGGADEFPFGVV